MHRLECQEVDVFRMLSVRALGEGSHERGSDSNAASDDQTSRILEVVIVTIYGADRRKCSDEKGCGANRR
jgi:hypothetical protein